MADADSNLADRVHLNLLENGLDFLLSAAEAVQGSQSPRSLKDAVLHVANGTELLFKARLAEEHWTLIFANPDEASYEKLSDAEFRSVNFRKAIDRLGKIAEVYVDKSVIAHLENLRKLRNRLTHFTTTLNSSQTKSLVAKSMKFCVEFCEQQGMAAQEVQSKLREIVVKFTELQEFVDDRMDTISGELKGSFVQECPECWQYALVSEEGTLHCRFCMHRTDARDLAESRSEGSVEDCPECLQQSTFAYLIFDSDFGAWFCFSCGAGGERYDYCMRCGQMAYFPDLNNIKFCEDCWSRIMSRG